jgi:acylphosphatase
MPPETSQRRIVYSGRVQGVGFRMTARRIARRYKVSGFVRNLSNGTVEVVVAGAANETVRFLDALADAMSGCIAAANETALTGETLGETFEIRF